MAGAYLGQISGYINNGASARSTSVPQGQPRHTTAYWADELQREAQKLVPGATVVAVPATDISGGNAQPIDEVISSVDGTPSRTPPSHRGARGNAGRDRRDHLGVADAPQSTSSSIATARARSTRASAPPRPRCARPFGGDLATQFTGEDGLKDVLVTYPLARSLARRDRAIPIRANDGSIVYVGDIAHLVQDAGAADDHAHQPCRASSTSAPTSRRARRSRTCNATSRGAWRG
jgi:hypothetical protein